MGFGASYRLHANDITSDMHNWNSMICYCPGNRSAKGGYFQIQSIPCKDTAIYFNQTLIVFMSKFIWQNAFWFKSDEYCLYAPYKSMNVGLVLVCFVGIVLSNIDGSLFATMCLLPNMSSWRFLCLCVSVCLDQVRMWIKFWNGCNLLFKLGRLSKFENARNAPGYMDKIQRFRWHFWQKRSSGHPNFVSFQNFEISDIASISRFPWEAKALVTVDSMYHRSRLLTW